MSESGRRSRRLFFALWPSEDLRERLAAEAGAAIQDGGGRPVPARNLHITLLFLGEVEETRFNATLEAAAGLSAAPFELVFDQIEVWPESSVLCLTSQRPPPELDALHRDLRTRLSAVGFEFRRQKFRPHVTLARDVPRRRSAEPSGSQRRPLRQPLRWPVSEFVLVESNMTKAGADYAVLMRWPLIAAKTR